MPEVEGQAQPVRVAERRAGARSRPAARRACRARARTRRRLPLRSRGPAPARTRRRAGPMRARSSRPRRGSRPDRDDRRAELGRDVDGSAEQLHPPLPARGDERPGSARGAGRAGTALRSPPRAPAAGLRAVRAAAVRRRRAPRCERIEVDVAERQGHAVVSVLGRLERLLDRMVHQAVRDVAVAEPAQVTVLRRERARQQPQR